jgi:hypothetical protein
MNHDLDQLILEIRQEDLPRVAAQALMEMRDAAQTIRLLIEDLRVLLDREIKAGR